MVFYGEYEGTMTEGGRVALPKKIREVLHGSQIVITRGFGNCLAGYDKHDWEKRAEDLITVSLLEKEHIDKRRLLFSSTVYVDLDEQGRMIIPKPLQTSAGIQKKVVISGVGDHFEVWSQEAWNQYITKLQQDGAL